MYTPYLDSLGGGERYMLTIAEILSSENSVDLLLDKHLASLGPEKLKLELGRRFDLDISRVNFMEAPLGAGSSPLKRLFFLRNYDLLFYLTDGSFFYATAKRNVIHFQAPFKNTSAAGFWGRLKLSSWDFGIYNSEFTKSYVEQEWPIKGQVIYPPVDVNKIKPLPKKKYVLSVGRFTSFLKLKKHEEMIRAFANICKSEAAYGWSLHLAGSLEGDPAYLDELKKLAAGLPVVFHPNLEFKDLVHLYGESSIYWHAMGLGQTDPSKMEHFGISTVEAMAAGCVPIVINLGGQREIVEDGISGLLWDTIKELEGKTLEVMNDSKLRDSLAGRAHKSSQKFSRHNFAKRIMEIAYGK